MIALILNLVCKTAQLIIPILSSQKKKALVDTSHLKFKQLYFDALNQVINPQDLDYLIISHTEPDHSGLVKDLLEIGPHITVVASKVAIQFLEGFVHLDFKKTDCQKWRSPRFR